MKKIFNIAIILIIMILLTGCIKKTIISIDKTIYDLEVGEEIKPKIYVSNLKSYELTYEFDKTGIVEITNGTIAAIKEGTVVVKIGVSGKKKVEPIEITINVSNVPIISINKTSYELEVGDEEELDLVTSNVESPKYTYEFDKEGIVVINNNTITALSSGSVVVKIGLENNEKVKPVEITVTVTELPHIKIERETDTLECAQSMQVSVTKVDVTGYAIWNSSNRDVATISNTGLIRAVSSGTTIIQAKVGTYVDEFILTIVKPLATEINVEELNKLELNSSVVLKCSMLPELASQEYAISSSDSTIIEIKDNAIIGKSLGQATVTFTTIDGSNLSTSITIIVIENAAPVITGDSSKITINWNDMDSIYQGLTAIDNCDGDITELIQVDPTFDCKEYGVHTVDYTVSDKAGNIATFTREVEVVWGYGVKFIGHMGSYFGRSNSEEAIRYALEVLGYQAVEIDLQQTKDGVFILNHDSYITLDDGTKITLSEKTWEELKDIELTETRNSGYPSRFGMVENGGVYTSTLCTLDTYLQLCKEYNAMAVIELKTSPGISNYSQNRMQALMDAIEAQGMLNNVIFLTSQNECLRWVKTNGYEYIECQYLVGSCESLDVYNECKTYGFTVSINVTDYSNKDGWLEMYKLAGIKISTYTFSQWNAYEQLQQWIDKGVDYVTVDWHRMDMVDLTTNLAEETDE